MDVLWEVTCPACGGLVEASDRDELVQRAREHTLDAHRYDIPRQHVLDSVVPAGDPPSTSACAPSEVP